MSANSSSWMRDKLKEKIAVRSLKGKPADMVLLLEIGKEKPEHEKSNIHAQVWISVESLANIFQPVIDNPENNTDEKKTTAIAENLQTRLKGPFAGAVGKLFGLKINKAKAKTKEVTP
jgi:hypothetical protein